MFNKIFARPSDPPTPQVTSSLGDDDRLTLFFRGRLDSDTTSAVWRESMAQLEQHHPRTLVVDASQLDYCDGSGISLLFKLRSLQQKSGGSFQTLGLKSEFQNLLDIFTSSDFQAVPVTDKPQDRSITVEIGRSAHRIWSDLGELVTFVGELSVGVSKALLAPRLVRWKDTFKIAESTGVNALPIVTLVSFLVGLIMSFQAAIPMQMFGATIYVANLIGLSMVRELGPLMTAIVLAGRSGSAFAAEIGTMKVNEEIDALTTMGLDPVRFLVVPRVLAAVFMTPLLTVYANLVGILGGAIVLLSLGFPLVAYVNQVLSAIDYVDFIGGIVKAFVFGVLIAGIGCLRGLQTGTGASAVGDSTTKAVVSGIVFIVATDGIFSVMYYYLGI
jgi:phospholipid/cholesterol/gamma-HCH transport system permease protein